MIPKESGFNQSATTSAFPGSSAIARDGEVKQRQFFLSSRRHNLPSKVRLCNNQTARDVYMSMQQ